MVAPCTFDFLRGNMVDIDSIPDDPFRCKVEKAAVILIFPVKAVDTDRVPPWLGLGYLGMFRSRLRNEAPDRLNSRYCLWRSIRTLRNGSGTTPKDEKIPIPMG